MNKIYTTACHTEAEIVERIQSNINEFFKSFYKQGIEVMGQMDWFCVIIYKATPHSY